MSIFYWEFLLLIRKILLVIPLQGFSADWILEGIADLEMIKKITFPDETTYSIYTAETNGTSNTGFFWFANCAGDSLVRKGKMIETNFYCNTEVSDGNKFYMIQTRSKTDKDLGVGKSIIMGGTNIYNELIGTECKYAVQFFKNNKVSVRNICKIPDHYFIKMKK